MKSLTTRLISYLILAGFATLLTACGGDSPPRMYTVTHYNSDLEVINTFTVQDYYASEGCAFFKPPNHTGNDRWSMLCGNVTGNRETVADVAAQNAVYLIKHLKPNGEVFATHKAVEYYASEGCAFYRPLSYHGSDRWSMICGDVTGEKLPQ